MHPPSSAAAAASSSSPPVETQPPTLLPLTAAASPPMDSDAAGSLRAPTRFRRDWAMLDCFLRPLRDGYETLVYVSTRTGDKLGVGLMAVEAPRISYLVYHWIPKVGSAGSSRESLNFWHAKAVAAHHNSILLRFVFPRKAGMSLDETQEFFVYQTTTRTLKKLPRCRHHSFIMYTNSGVLSRENGDFAVAHLTVLPGARGVTVDLCCLFFGEDSWRTKKCVPICCAEGEEKNLKWWEADAVVSFADTICWVDYLRGFLCFDVGRRDLEVRYVPLPVDPYQGSLHPHLGIRGCLARFRSLSVTNNGSGLKFVDVAPSDCWFCPQATPRQYNAINSWRLTEEWLWVEDGVITQDQFSDLTLGHNLPCNSQLRSPFVDMRDPETVYFVLTEKQEKREEQFCLISVCMKSCTMHRIECEFRSFQTRRIYSHTTSYNLRYHEPMLALNLDDTNVTSRNFGKCTSKRTANVDHPCVLGALERKKRKSFPAQHPTASSGGNKDKK